MLRALARHGVQERPGRAGPRRRQGRDHRRPGDATRPRRCCAPTAASWQSLGGRYVTACDVGTYVADMDVVGTRDPLRHRPQPRPTAAPATPRCSPRTASSRACGPARSTCGAPHPAPGARSASPGSARSGGCLAAHLIEDGADVVVTDVSEQAVEAVPGQLPPGRRRTGRRGAGQAATWTSTPRAPSAAPWTTSTVESLSASIVCGAANNQLADESGHGSPAAAGPGHHLRAGLPGQRRRRDPGQPTSSHGFSFERAGPDAPEDLRPHRVGASPGGRARASPRPSRPTGSPSSGCRASAARAGSGSRPAEPALLVASAAPRAALGRIPARPAAADRAARDRQELADTL